MKYSVMALGLIFFAFCGQISAGVPWVITATGYGSVHVGMTAPQAEKLLETKLSLEESPLVGDCFIATPQRGHKGLYLMIDAGVITHVGVGLRGIADDVGLRVGDTADKVKRLYGTKLEIEEHPYEDNAFYYYVWNQDRSRGKRYEINSSGLIVEIRGGDASIQLIEGPCS